MTILDTAAVAEMRARAEKATEGPWTSDDDIIVLDGKRAPVTDCEWGSREQSGVNADFIAHARTDLPALAQSHEELRALERDLGGAYVRLRHIIPGALDTPHAPSPETCWQITEDAARVLVAENAALRAKLEACKAVVRAAGEWCAIDDMARRYALREAFSNLKESP